MIKCDPDDEEEQDRLLQLFEANVPHPEASDLIFFPDHKPVPEHEKRSLTAEEVVDHAVAYNPVGFAPATASRSPS